MNFIINPYTFEKHSLFSRKGISLLKNYVKLYQSGGSVAGGGAAAAAGQTSLGGMRVEGGRKGGNTCPIYIDEDGSKHLLAIHSYNEIEAEKAGSNPLLINEEILNFLKKQKEPTIMTWVILVKPQTSTKPIGQRPAEEMYTLVAVHNESFYEFSAKHDTIITRILSNENRRFPNIGPNPYFASGELMYSPSGGLFYNLQSGTFFTKKIEPQGGRFNLEAAKKIGAGKWLKELLDPNDLLGEPVYKEETFINNRSYISPKYIKKLNKLRTLGLVKFKLFKENDSLKCKEFTRQPFIRIAINQHTRTLENLKKLLKSKSETKSETKSEIRIYEKYKKMYETKIEDLEKLIEKERKKLREGTRSNPSGS